MRTLIQKLVHRSPELMAAARAVRHHRLLSREPLKTPWNFRLNGSPGMIDGTFEVKETTLLTGLLKSADVFVNVGANVGYYCAHAIAAGKTCIALEPHPENVNLLLRNLKVNNWTAEVHPVACGEGDAILELYGGGTAASLVKGWAGLPEVNPHLVPVRRLDDVIGDRFSEQRLLILIDVEGAELGVLNGASRLLGRLPSPQWVVEICIDEHHATENGRNPNLLDTFDRFLNAGYRAFSVEEDGREVSRGEIDEISKGGKNTIKGHNFLFSATEINWPVDGRGM